MGRIGEDIELDAGRQIAESVALLLLSTVRGPPPPLPPPPASFEQNSMPFQHSALQST